MTQPLAQYWKQRLESALMLEHCRMMKAVSETAVVTIDNFDRHEYRFDFEDNSVLIVNQHTARAIATDVETLERQQ